jgi:CubicO group peptidase (beta-lactamase class C family)
VTRSTVEGTCDARFVEVGEELQRNFAARGEVGAGVCVIVDDETVVDLWGGTVDPAGRHPWGPDTLTSVWSCTKGATALCAHILADRDELDLDAPVARYWPEFAKNGKADVPVAMLLNHEAGLPALRELLPDGAFGEWDLMVERLAAEEPFWPPGTRHGYHALTFGWLVGEVVRRVAGQTLGNFFAEQVARPLGLEFWIGLPEELEPRVAPVLPGVPNGAIPPFYEVALTEPSSVQGLILLNNGGLMADPNRRAVHAAEIGAAGGISNARGLAQLYRPLATGGAPLLQRLESIARMAAVSSAGLDAVMLARSRFSLGFFKSVGDLGANGTCALGEDAFGHPGMGGSIGFADPACRLSFGYAMNLHGVGTMLNERGQALVDATYRALGYRTRAPGAWVR